MLDLSYIPSSQQDIKIFTAVSGSNAWQTWQKPRKCQWVWVMAIGSGGGGAGGPAIPGAFCSTGGASGAVVRAVFNAAHLPDTLYVQVGLGGAGGGPGLAGSSGSRSFISILPNTTITNVVAASGQTATAGGAPSNSSPTGESVTAFSNTAVFLTLANYTAIGGRNASGSSTQIPANITPLASQITCPGASGAEIQSIPPVAYNGGSVQSSSLSPLIQGGISTLASGSAGTAGAHGITSWKPFFSTGGAGGGASISGSGGAGGNGGIGSGGGGGGSGNLLMNASYAGGVGGKGGDGLVAIVSF